MYFRDAHIFPDYAYVVNPADAVATLVQKTECYDEDTSTTVDNTTTSGSTVTTNIRNDVVLDDLPQPSTAPFPYDTRNMGGESTTNAAAGRLMRSYFDFRIDGNDCLLIEAK